MATYWTNFAKHGDPNGEGLPQWPAFSDSNPVVMYFGQTPHPGPVPSAEALKALDAISPGGGRRKVKLRSNRSGFTRGTTDSRSLTPVIL